MRVVSWRYVGRRHMRWLVCSVALGLVVVSCTSPERPHLSGQDAPLPEPAPGVVEGSSEDVELVGVIPERSFLGNPFAGDTLANLDVGGVDGTRLAYRFRAERSGQLASLRPYIVVNTSRLGYAAGTGGTVKLTIVADDGSGLPDENQIVARGEKVMELVDGHLPEPADTEEKRRQNYSAIPISGDPLIAGQLYHVVFEQIDPNPVENYVGLDLMYQLDTQVGPRPSLEDWGLSISDSENPWSDFTMRFGEQLYTPIMSIAMDSGYVFGNGYLEPFPETESHRPVDESSSIQVTFTAEHDFNSKTWWLRAMRSSDSGILEARLEWGDGQSEVIEIPVEEFPSGETRWVEWGWEHAFVAGEDYVLTLSGRQGGQLSLFPLREGAMYNFEPGSVFGGISRPSNGNGGFEGWHKDRSDDIFIHADIMMAWTS